MFIIESTDKSASAEVSILDAHRAAENMGFEISTIIDTSDKWVFCISVPDAVKNIEFKDCTTNKDK